MAQSETAADEEQNNEPHPENVASARHKYVSRGNLRRADQHLEAAFNRLLKARAALNADDHLHDVDLDFAEGQFDRWLMGAIAQSHDVRKMTHEEYERRKQND